VEEADRVGFELLLRRLVPLDIWQLADAVALQTAVQRGIASDAGWSAGGMAQTVNLILTDGREHLLAIAAGRSRPLKHV
jgi:hypothetical protein